MSESKFDTDMDDHPTCPYCGYVDEEDGDAGDLCRVAHDGAENVECQQCGREFELSGDVYYYFTSRKIKEV